MAKSQTRFRLGDRRILQCHGERRRDKRTSCEVSRVSRTRQADSCAYGPYGLPISRFHLAAGSKARERSQILLVCKVRILGGGFFSCFK